MEAFLLSMSSREILRGSVILCLSADEGDRLISRLCLSLTGGVPFFLHFTVTFEI